MSEAYSRHRGEKIEIGFLWGNLKDIDYLEHLCIQ